MTRWRMIFHDRHRWWDVEVFAHGELVGTLKLSHARYRELKALAGLAGISIEVKTNRATGRRDQGCKTLPEVHKDGYEQGRAEMASELGYEDGDFGP